MSQFVVVYDRATGKSRIREFSGESARADALEARFLAERLAQSTEEVAVLSAPSREALKVTHSRYFHGVRGALDDLREALAV